ncbi:hypothetical protein Tco_0486857 [Tanacetum coccineum]
MVECPTLAQDLKDSIQKALRVIGTAEFKRNLQAEKKRYIDLIDKSVKDIINDEAAASLTEFELKKILINKMEKSQSNLTADEEKELYKALDKDEDPPARLDQGMKRQKTSKDIELTKGSKSKESKSTSSSKGTTRSQPKSSGKSAQAEEPIHIVDDTEVQQNQGQDM